MAKDYGHDNLGERVITRFYFSIVDYSVITESKASNQGSAGGQSLKEL